MTLMSDNYRLMARLLDNPDEMEEKIEAMNQAAEVAKEWLANPIEKPSDVQDIHFAASALFSQLSASMLPFDEAGCQFVNAVSCIYNEAVSRAYLKGRRDAMAEMVLCGDPDETK